MSLDPLKFTSTGQVRPYYGNTIIAPYDVPEAGEEGQAVIQAAQKVQERFKASPLASKLAFLPPSSFHTTIYTLLRVRDRGTARWPKWLSDRYQHFAEVDQAVYDRIADIPVPCDVQMRCEQVTAHKLLLSPATPEDEAKLRGYRDQVAARMEIVEEGHNSYVFHISLSYHLVDLDAEDQRLEQGIAELALRDFQAAIPIFSLPVPRFVIFNDMLSYHEDLKARGDLF